MFSALSDATGQIDPKYLISYSAPPALVATFASVGVFAILVGPPIVDIWANNLDSVRGSIGALLLGVASVLSLFLKAMRRPIIMLFAGDILPHPVADWAAHRQHRTRVRAEQAVLAAGESATEFSIRQKRRILERGFPQGSGTSGRRAMAT